MATANQNLAQKLEDKLQSIEHERLEDAARALAKEKNLPYIDTRINLVNGEALRLLPESEAIAAQLAIITRTGKELKVATTDPDQPAVKKIVQSLTQQGFIVNLGIVSAPSLQKLLNGYRSVSLQAEAVLGSISVNQKIIDAVQAKVKNLADLKSAVAAASATELLEIFMAGAIKIGASDIHFEPEEKVVRSRYRLDGLLQDAAELTSEQYNKLLSRIKINAGLKLNVHESPQDGRFTVHYPPMLGASDGHSQEREIEIRTSILPGAFGENIVMRLLDPAAVRQDIKELGLTPDNLAIVEKLLQKSTGAILTTGPTGSGKTTTLYAFLQHVNQSDVKIITIEDPVEYHLAGIAQTQVDSERGYTFASGLRSIVRQDPDVILVGEIRDGETAGIAMQAALTGHLVFSTLHTNNAAGAIPRLVDLGVRPETIAPAINAIMAQRLVRRLCPSCRHKEKISTADYQEIKPTLDQIIDKKRVPAFDENTELYYPGQCAECNNTGFKGRVGIFEIFLIDPEMEQLILKSPAISDVAKLATQKGMLTMLQDGYLRVLNGETAVEEVRRVAG